MAMVGLDATVSAVLKSGNAGVTTVSLTSEIGNLIETEVNMNKLKRIDDPSSRYLKKIMLERPRECSSLYNRMHKISNDTECWTDDIKVR